MYRFVYTFLQFSSTWLNLWLFMKVRLVRVIIIIPPQRCCRGVYWFHHVRPSVRPSVCPSVCRKIVFRTITWGIIMITRTKRTFINNHKFNQVLENWRKVYTKRYMKRACTTHNHFPHLRVVCFFFIFYFCKL
jgi:hypothetical protein